MTNDIWFDNYTNDWNMNVMVNRWKNGNKDEKYEQFKDSITLSGNLCNIKNHTYEGGDESI